MLGRGLSHETGEETEQVSVPADEITSSCRTLALAALLSLGAHATALGQASPGALPPPTLRVVGGLAGLNQYTRQEEPFWTRRLGELSAGRLRVEIVPFGALLLSHAAPRDAEFAASEPVLTPLQPSKLDCAPIGTIAGHAIDPGTVTTHVLPLPPTWGPSMFVAHGPRWLAHRGADGCA
jgi:hypothetical protein